MGDDGALLIQWLGDDGALLIQWLGDDGTLVIQRLGDDAMVGVPSSNAMVGYVVTARAQRDPLRVLLLLLGAHAARKRLNTPKSYHCFVYYNQYTYITISIPIL